MTDAATARSGRAHKSFERSRKWRRKLKLSDREFGHGQQLIKGQPWRDPLLLFLKRACAPVRGQTRISIPILSRKFLHRRGVPHGLNPGNLFTGMR